MDQFVRELHERVFFNPHSISVKDPGPHNTLVEDPKHTAYYKTLQGVDPTLGSVPEVRSLNPAKQ